MSRPGSEWIRKDEGRCRSCGAPIVWWVTPSGKLSPHDPDGTSHFATCPHADHHRQKAQVDRAIASLTDASPETDAGKALVVLLDDSFTRAALRIGSDSFRPKRKTLENMVALVETEARELRNMAAAVERDT